MTQPANDEPAKPVDSKQRPSRPSYVGYIVWALLGCVVGPIGGCYAGVEVLTRAAGPEGWVGGVLWGSALGLMAGPGLAMGIRFVLFGRKE